MADREDGSSSEDNLLDESDSNLVILYDSSLRAGSHLGAHVRVAKSEFKSEVIL